MKRYKKLPYTFIAYFLLTDVHAKLCNYVGVILTWSVPVVRLGSKHSCYPGTNCRNDRFTFSFKKNIYLFRFCGSKRGNFWCPRILVYTALLHWKIDPKMFIMTNNVTVLIPLWGMIGIWTDKFGFRNEWEFWVQIAVFRLYQASYLFYSQTLMAELSRPGFDHMQWQVVAAFFGLFGLSNRASSIIEPNVVQAIVNGKHLGQFSILVCAQSCVGSDHLVGS
ncbi:vacuole effluxer Atg22 like-domain-containing protein [Lactifluus subvellereus]|nr:vacuole effluxer Atg22 like-domain-containing protein [Lactifluus subvellereus]